MKSQPLRELFDRIREQADQHSSSWEIVFVDDGSTDGSWAVIEELAKEYPKNVEALRFRTNRGKAAALNSGYEKANGDIIFTSGCRFAG